MKGILHRNAIVWALCALAFLGGCSRAGYIVLVNGSGSEMRVLNRGVWHTLPANDTLTIDFDANVRQTEIAVAGARFGYQWAYPPFAPAGYFERKGSSHGFVLQVDASHNAYVVPPYTRKPVAEFPEQPSGFPLAPKERKDESEQKKPAL